MLADEEAVQLAAEEFRARRLFQGDADDVGRLPRAGLLQERLFPGVVAAREKPAPPLRDGPAGEGTGGRANVRLRVMADAEGKQFQELTAEVLIGLLLLAAGPVEPDEHGGVGEDGGQ